MARRKRSILDCRGRVMMSPQTIRISDCTESRSAWSTKSSRRRLSTCRAPTTAMQTETKCTLASIAASLTRCPFPTSRTIRSRRSSISKWPPTAATTLSSSHLSLSSNGPFNRRKTQLEPSRGTLACTRLCRPKTVLQSARSSAPKIDNGRIISQMKTLTIIGTVLAIT